MLKLLFKLACLLIPPLRKISNRIDQLKVENENNLIPRLQELLWVEKDVRQNIEEAGIKISPNNFYANIPSKIEIKNSFKFRQC